MIANQRDFPVAVLVSGRGSNMEALLKAEQAGELGRATVRLVVSDNPEAKALEIARSYGVRAEYIDGAPFKTKLEGAAEERYIQAIRESGARLVVMAGFMRMLKPAFISAFSGRIVNIHPSLLPAYPGLHTHERAIEAGEQFAGCTVHFVNEVMDGGKRIIQARVPVKPGDTPEILAVRVLEQEHQIFKRVIRWISEGRLTEETCPEEPFIFNERMPLWN